MDSNSTMSNLPMNDIIFINSKENMYSNRVYIGCSFI